MCTKYNHDSRFNIEPKWVGLRDLQKKKKILHFDLLESFEFPFGCEIRNDKTYVIHIC